MKKTILFLIATWIFVLVSLVGCKGGSTSPTTPTAPPPPVQRAAQVSVTLSNPSVRAVFVPKTFRLSYDVKIVESAGTDIHINFMRLEAKDPTNPGRYERAELGSDVVTAQLGSNKVSGGTTWQHNVYWYMNLWNGGYAFQITVDYTDVYGNNGQAVFKSPTYLNRNIGEQIRALQ